MLRLPLRVHFKKPSYQFHHEKVVEDELEETEDVLPFAWDED